MADKSPPLEKGGQVRCAQTPPKQERKQAYGGRIKKLYPRFALNGQEVSGCVFMIPYPRFQFDWNKTGAVDGLGRDKRIRWQWTF